MDRSSWGWLDRPTALRRQTILWHIVAVHRQLSTHRRDQRRVTLSCNGGDGAKVEGNPRVGCVADGNIDARTQTEAAPDVHTDRREPAHQNLLTDVSSPVSSLARSEHTEPPPAGNDKPCSPCLTRDIRIYECAYSRQYADSRPPV